jgi:hypothetical protein
MGWRTVSYAKKQGAGDGARYLRRSQKMSRANSRLRESQTESQTELVGAEINQVQITGLCRRCTGEWSAGHPPSCRSFARSYTGQKSANADREEGTDTRKVAHSQQVVRNVCRDERTLDQESPGSPPVAFGSSPGGVRPPDRYLGHRTLDACSEGFRSFRVGRWEVLHHRWYNGWSIEQPGRGFVDYVLVQVFDADESTRRN